MAVSADDIVCYLSAGKPENDTASSGGAIDADTQLLERDHADIGGAGDTIEALSSEAGDTTQKLTVEGYDDEEAWASEEIALTGTTPVATTTTFKYVAKVRLDADCTGNVTVRQETTPANVIHLIPAGERGAQRLFLGAQANSAGGATKYLYEKIFVKNCHATDKMELAKDWLDQDEESELTMDCELSEGVTVTDGTQATTNRVTEPTGGYSWGQHASEGEAHAKGDSEDGDLTAGEAQGIWVRLTLAAGRSSTLATQYSDTTKGTVV